MDPYGNFNETYEGTTITTFKTVKLQRQQNGYSWSIVGFLSDENFRVLGVLDKPIPHSLMVEFAKKVADEFKATFQES